MTTAGVLTASGSAARSRVATGLIVTLGVSCAILLTTLLYRSSFRYPLNYNEGWNSFWAQRAARGEAIYPAADAMVFNNYPPLSFFLVAAFSKLGIDVWIAGRVVAWLSFAGCAALIRATLREMGSSSLGANLGAAFFCGLMAVDFNLYLGMYDPQLTAHCGMLAGLFLLVRGGAPSRRSVILAALVLVASGFIKHNLLALPAAITLWLVLCRRDLLVAWLVTAAAALAIGFLLCWGIFGDAVFVGLATPRVWSLHNVALKLSLWMPPLVAPTLIALGALAFPGRDPFRVLLGVFAAIALLVACFVGAGDGVVYNAFFELIIAGSLAIGYVIGDVRGGGSAWQVAPARDAEWPGAKWADADWPSGKWPGGKWPGGKWPGGKWPGGKWPGGKWHGGKWHAPLAWIALAEVAIIAASTSVAATGAIVDWNDWVAGQYHRQETAARAVALIAAQPGPALCEDPLLCYWANKPFAVDIFNYQQSVASGQRDGQAVRAEIVQGHFGAIQLNPVDNRLLPDLQAAIRLHYDPVDGLPGLFRRRAANAGGLP